MTVREMMALLATLPADAMVRFPDTYEQSEGWGAGHLTATCLVGGAEVVDGAVVLYEGEEYDEDEDEDEDED